MAKDILADAETQVQDTESPFLKFEKTFSMLRLTLNALHLMKHSDKDNARAYESLQE